MLTVASACLAVFASVAGANWSPRAAPLFPRGVHQAVVVDSKIYVLGGRNGGGPLTPQVEMYDPRTDAWLHVADMPSPRSIFAAAVWKDQIYVFGGNGRPLADLEAVVERYDPSTGGWMRLSDMPVRRSGHAAETIGDAIYIVGDGERVDRYDPTTDTWARVRDMPAAFSSGTAVVDGRLYAFGDFLDHNRVYEYDPVADRWREGSPMPTPRVAPYAVAVGAEIYVIGGSRGLGAALEITRRTVEIHDPETDAWRAGPSTAVPHDQGTSAVVNGVIYVIGGHRLPGPARLRPGVEAWDTGIRAVSPGARTVLATWGDLRREYGEANPRR